MLFDQAFIKGGLHPASRLSICIEVLASKGDHLVQIGTGTGFLHRRSDSEFLITNWHVITGRNPKSPQHLLDGYPDSPSAFRVYYAKRENQNFLIRSPEFALYRKDGKPNWIETTLGEERPDLVALPIEISQESAVSHIEDFKNPAKGSLRIGKEVVVVGYPFGIRADYPFPIWKRGYVASEPSLLVGGQPKFFLDMPGRPGLSGSPVFTVDSGFEATKELSSLIAQYEESPVGELAEKILKQLDPSALKSETSILRFVGTFSGTMNDGDLTKLGLGIVWNGAMIDRLFENPKEGENPYPPNVVTI